MVLKFIIILFVINVIFVVNGFIYFDFKLWVFELILKCYEENVFEFVSVKVLVVCFNFDLGVDDFKFFCLVVKVCL